MTNPYSQIVIAQRVWGEGHDRAVQTQETTLAEEAPALLTSLETLVDHVAHYASMPHAHPDAHRDVADARATIAKAKGEIR